MTGKKEEVSIFAAVEKLKGSTVSTRTEGLDALKQIFGQDRLLYRIDELSDDSCHKIIESLFNIVRSDKPLYVRASSVKARSSAQSRLTNTAQALRVVVDAIGGRLKQKTASAVLDHIVDILPDVDGGFCEPIQLEYSRSLSILLSHGSRVEHLRHRQWQTYADFILENVNDMLENELNSENASSIRQQSTVSKDGQSMSIRVSQSSISKTQQHTNTHHQAEFVLEQLFSALKYLTSSTNAPLLTRYGQILKLIVRWLETVSRSEDIAFDILNNVLPIALSEDVTLAAGAFRDVSQLIRQRDLWSKKSVTLKENILATMILCRSLFLSTAWSSPLLTISCLEQLLYNMRSDYEKLKDRERLQVEDLGFTYPVRASLLSLNGIDLASEAPHVINTWSTISTIACLLVGMSSRRLTMEHSTDQETVHKRRKLDNPINDLFHEATSPNPQSQLLALPIALFVVNQEKAINNSTVDLLSRMQLTDLEDEPVVASWTCLLLARIVNLDDSKHTLQPEFWKRVWSWAARASAATAITRSACYLLFTMIRSRTIRLILSSQTICESIFPDGVSGPSALTDAALLLLESIVASGLLDTEKSFKYFASHSLRWLDNQWTISSVPDRLHNAAVASFARSENLYTFLMAVVGIHNELRPPSILNPASSICTAFLVDSEDLKFTQYMLSDSTASVQRTHVAESAHATYLPSSVVLNQLRQAVVDMLGNKVKSFFTACKSSDGERSSAVNLDVVETATTVCILCCTAARSLGSDQDWLALDVSVKMMWNFICSFLASQPRDSFPRSFSRIAMRLTSIQLLDNQAQNWLSTSRAELIASLDELRVQNSESQEKIAILEPDFLGSLQSRTSQNSQQRSSQTATEVVRLDLAMSSDIPTHFSRQSLLLRLDLARSRAEGEPGAYYSAMAVDAFISLEPEELLATKDIIVDFLDSDASIARADSSRLLTKLAQVCLEETQFSRCEAALCLCLRVTIRLTPLWVVEQDDDLAEVGYDIYQWFVNIALGKGIASQRVLFSIASLLEKILRYNPFYSADALPSARTSLLQILRTGQTGLKFKVMKHLSNLFNGYVLSEHPAVFDDIIDNLPSDPDKHEGIVLRLYIIASLGAQWHTILRQSIYHIFETAANVPAVATVAAKCVEAVCHELDLKSPRLLLRLFAPQVLYTWLEQQGLETMPFRAFHYNVLATLEVDIQDELVAQIAMRNSTQHAQNVIQSLGMSWDSLIEQWFAKVVAYAILTDVAMQRSSHEIGKAEMSLVQQLGEEAYADLCRKNLAKAISIILLRLSDDRGFEKVRGHDEAAHHHTTTYKLICSHSSSQMQLPPGQQPSFRAKHLPQILDRLCMRAQETLESVWTPALLIHVYRTLLADAKPAFGPLHTCAILRKIRVVVCLAGPATLSGYPLQMLLHALRPFLTQFHCSEDAFGVFWYLLEHGKTYLKQKLPFVTGLGVAVFASLSRFATSSQESTTQESHFTSTMTKAQEFRTWLGTYLEGFSVADLGDVAASAFVDIVRAAKQVTKAGSSAKTTAEGSLLYHLLADQASERPLLSATFFRLTLRSLCHDFTVVSDFQDDILYSDDDVLHFAPVLWSILDHQSSRDLFRIWVSQALGRAYALQGPTITELNTNDRRSSALSYKADVQVDDSYRSIVNILGDLLWDEDSTSASVSEATLQSIFSALPLANRAIVLGPYIDQSMFDELRFVELPCPSVSEEVYGSEAHLDSLKQVMDGSEWASVVVRKLSQQQKNDPVLAFLPALIDLVPSLAPAMLPHVIHLALYFETDKDQGTKGFLTQEFDDIFQGGKEFQKNRVRLALESIIHLRKCVLPLETTMAKRNVWLDIDFGAAAAAALQCTMYRMALLMLEIHVSQHTLAATRSSRRSSHGDLSMVPDVLNQIYQNVDDPDFFYGTHEESDVASIVEKLCHEGLGYKALSFQSALFDSNIKTRGMNYALNTSGGTTVSALNLANLSGLSSSIGSFVASEHQESVLEHSLESLLNLHQWDIAQDRALSDHGTAIMTALRTLSSASQRENIIAATDQSTLDLAQLLLGNIHHRAQQVNYWTSLAVLAELKEVLAITSSDDLEVLLQKRSTRRAWTEQESFECVEPLLLGREAIFATIKSNPQVRSMVGVTSSQAILLEIKSLRTSLSLGHVHEMSQFCLNRAAYLSELLPSATELGVRVEAAIQYDLANTFWAQHEIAASIRILQNLYERELPDQSIEVRQSEILTDLGSKITEARLDRPDEVTAKYLIPAIKALGKETMGSKVGRVFHNFAAFCDSQLRDADNVDEYERVEKIRDRKLQEVRELENMYKKGDSKTRDTVKAHFAKAKTWFKLDDEELQRLKAHRDRLVRNCLENYLLSLRACEDFPNDVLRFLALWMEQSANPLANASVSKYLSSIPTYKFAPLMNQLSSRILNEESPFQHLLSDLMYHICEDHPFHSLYQIFATSKSKGAQKDEVANSRHAAATILSEKVMKKKSLASNLWISIHNSNIQFVRVAQEKVLDRELKTGSKLLLRKLAQGAKLEQSIHDMHHKIPPPTMKIDIRPDGDYSMVPTIAKFDPQISIAGGVSAPKIITIIAADGSKHKMLLKGGNDDLRQDSIMEQVFEQVSNLLKDHRATRQRKLGIRTYKVIPLTHNAGIIEFVQDTMPLHDYVLPAHTRYYPKDYKPNKCRKEIADAQSKSLPQRLQAYRNVVANFHPVMRFFFMEHFLDPDEWFQKRLNYSRSTAAISMLGHVLGLGDRHGHNILLDTKTGEVVHIDLGVAFEAGRVLPVPEVVPFRLTRDLVDGMGLSGVEGVFRRCCNFTLEALRRNQEAIMTILDVLRWDPLYSWSVSPLRLARMQENQEQTAKTDPSTAGTNDVGSSTAAGLDGAAKHDVNEPSEADRALAVVSKKLGKSLSVEATVNELIRQAMDERNLAVLYCGWAAYA